MDFLVFYFLEEFVHQISVREQEGVGRPLLGQAEEQNSE